MADKRTGDEVSLLDSSLRAVGGTSVSTTLYMISGIVYVAVTGPDVAGITLFLILFATLVSRPVRGLSQTLHKIGSENGERVSSYLGISVIFGSAYFALSSIILYFTIGFVSNYTVITSDLLTVTILLVASSIPISISSGLISAVGYPSYKIWVRAIRDLFITGFLIVFVSSIETVTDLALVFVIFRLVFSIPLFIWIGTIPSLPDKREVTRAFNYAKWSVPDQVIDRFSYNMPTLVLGVVGTPLAVGVYEAADRFADFGATISWNLSSVFLTKVSGDWSEGDEKLLYLDSAVTGGIGVTIVVLGYLIPGRTAVAEIAFPEAPIVFSQVVIIVGLVNILRGFWTIVSHVMEGIGMPSVSFKTKIFGLIFSVPPTVFFGGEFGAFAGAIGYGLMNFVIFGYVLYYSYAEFERVLIDWHSLGELVLAMIVSSFATGIYMYSVEGLLTPVGVAVSAVPVTISVFCLVIYLISKNGRTVIERAFEMYIWQYLSEVEQIT